MDFSEIVKRWALGRHLEKHALRLDESRPYRPRGRKRRKRPDAGGVPVEPNRPGGLSGGAAAEIEFDS